MSNHRVVGIDLGTTNSLAAYVVDGKPQVVRDACGVALVPSCLSFQPDGSVLVGTPARRNAILNPEQTLFSVKRLMGRTFADLSAEMDYIPYQLTEREIDGGRKVLRVRVGDRELTPEELSALILKEVRSRAGDPTRAVITVPAYFDEAQRQATRDAGRIAGLDVLRIVNEPTAAALAYGLDRTKNGTVAVYDLGGGTFDCSILSLKDGVFKVLSTNGDTRLGGDDFDREIMKIALDGLAPNNREPELLQQLREEAERVKIALTIMEKVTFHRDFPGHEHTTNFEITRRQFEIAIQPHIDRTMVKCQSALRDANLTAKQIDEIVLVGGSTRIPYVRQQVEALFGRTPHSDINPDEVVALGAAVQADILSTGRRSLLLLDVVPLSLGIETLGGVVDKVVHRNSTVPCRETVRYTTFADNQTAILLNIYQGERELTKDCRRLGEFKLAGIPPLPAQMAQVDVTFLVDANGQLTVTAHEQRSGVQASVEVRAAHGLSQDEVERLVLESVEHAHADFTTRRFVELKNKADADLRHAAKAIERLGVEMGDDEKTRVGTVMTALKTAMVGTDVDVLQQALDAFGTETAPLAERQMNAAVKAVLSGQRADQMDAETRR